MDKRIVVRHGNCKIYIPSVEMVPAIVSSLNSDAGTVPHSAIGTAAMEISTLAQDLHHAVASAFPSHKCSSLKDGMHLTRKLHASGYRAVQKKFHAHV